MTLLEELKETRRALQLMWLMDGFTHNHRGTNEPYNPLDQHHKEVMIEIGRVMRREKMKFDWLDWFNERVDYELDPNEGIEDA